MLCKKQTFLVKLEKPAMTLNERLVKCAKVLQDEKKITKLSTCVVVAQDLEYHTAYLTVLYCKRFSNVFDKSKDAFASLLHKVGIYIYIYLTS